MTSPRIERLQRITAALLAIGLITFLFLTVLQKQRWDTDIFWALKSGEWIISHLDVPRTDPFSYTFGGKEWVDFTWGFQVLAYAFFKAGGWAGLAVLQAALTGATFFLLYRCLMIVTERNLLLSLSFIYLVFITSFTRLYIRPHLFEYFFVTLYIYLLITHERKGSGRHIWLLLPLQALWVNIHSSFILGIFMAGAWAAGRFVSELKEGGLKAGISPGLRNLAILAALLPVFSVINPYGLKLAIFPFIHQSAGNYDAIRHILEWSRLPLSKLLVNFSIFPVDFFSFNVLLAVSVVSMAFNIRRLNVRDAILVGGFFYLAASHARWLSIFAFTAAPLAALNLQDCLKKIGDKGRSMLGVALIASSAVFLSLVTYVFFADFSSNRSELGIGLKRGVFPEVTAAYIKKEGLAGKVYNEYAFGGYLIHNDIKVFIDGRTPTVFSPYLFWQWRMAEKNGEAWQRLVREYGLEVALIKSDTPLCARLWKEEGWAPAIFDDVSVLYIKAGGKSGTGPLALKNVYPCNDKPRYEFSSDTEKLMGMRGEMKAMIGYMTQNGLSGLASRPYRVLGLIETRLGGDYLEDAVKEIKTALSIVDSADTRYDLGVALGKLGKRAEAVEAFKKTLALDSGYKEAYLALGLAYSDMKDCGQAVRHLEKYVELADDGAVHDSYRTLGMCYFDQGNHGLAAHYLKRAAFTADGTKTVADIYYKAGSSLFETGDYKEGAEYYGRAVEADQAYKDVLQRLARNLSRAGREDASKHILNLPQLTGAAGR